MFDASGRAQYRICQAEQSLRDNPRRLSLNTRAFARALECDSLASVLGMTSIVKVSTVDAQLSSENHNPKAFN
jgi:hypothetical protein